MFRGVLCFDGERLELSQSLDDVAPPEHGLRWIDIQGQTKEDLQLLGQRFRFHPLALEDCEHLDQRPKIEDYKDHLFLVVHTFSCPPDTIEVELHEMHVFFSRQFLVTVHSDPIPAVDALWSRVQAEPDLFRRGLDFLLYLVCDRMVDANFPILDRLTERIDELETSMLDPMAERDPEAIQKIVALKRSLVTMRRVLSPQREVFNFLAGRSPFISEHSLAYFRDIYDHLVRLYETIDTGRDLLGNALDAHFSVLSQRTNEIMKRLTIVSIVFLPLTFLTGFFGMNFTHMPFDNDLLLAGMLVSCLVLPTSLFIWFRRKRWFS